MNFILVGMISVLTGYLYGWIQGFKASDEIYGELFTAFNRDMERITTMLEASGE